MYSFHLVTGLFLELYYRCNAISTTTINTACEDVDLCRATTSLSYAMFCCIRSRTVLWSQLMLATVVLGSAVVLLIGFALLLLFVRHFGGT